MDQKKLKVLDDNTSMFIRIITADVELDFKLGRILTLFALDPPEMWGGYRHHDQLVTSEGR
jgi:hypothetical protein